MVWVVREGFCKTVILNSDILVRKKGGPSIGDGMSVIYKIISPANFLFVPFFIPLLLIITFSIMLSS